MSSVNFNSNGTILASGSYDRTIKLWDIETKTEIINFLGHNGPVICVAFNSTGTILASGSYGTIKLWNIGTKKEIANL